MKKTSAFGLMKISGLGATVLLITAVLCAPQTARSELSRQDSIYETVYECYMKDGFVSIDHLMQHFQNAQVEWMMLVPPGMSYMSFSGGTRYVEWGNYPKDFNAGLIGVTRGKTIVYPVTVFEDFKTGDYVFVNAEGKEFYSVSAPADYDSSWLARSYFSDLYTSERSQPEIESLECQYDPARVVIQYDLAGEEAILEIIESLAAAQVVSASNPPMVLKSGGVSITNIKFTAIEKLTNGSVQVEISYPIGFTNKLDIFSVDSGLGLLDFWWDLRDTENVSSSTNYITWTDSYATNAIDDIRFYVAANADLSAATDSDNDNLTWGRETFLYHTSPTNSDTDADGYDDYEEVVTMNTDPNNNDITSPTVFICLPINNAERIWIP